MAFIGGGEGSGKRRVDHDLPLVPFIDFLLCLVAFLLVTAVWTQYSRMGAQASGGASAEPERKTPVQLHVSVSEGHFDLKWRQGGTVIDTSRVPRKPVRINDGSPRYPELARVLHDQWRAHGQHRALGDAQLDQAVLHASNGTAYEELIAVMDALKSPKRPFQSATGLIDVPAFTVSFATD